MLNGLILTTGIRYAALMRGFPDFGGEKASGHAPLGTASVARLDVHLNVRQGELSLDALFDVLCQAVGSGHGHVRVHDQVELYEPVGACFSRAQAVKPADLV